MSSSILDPSALTAKLPKLLPKGNKALKSPQDALAALVHTVLAVLGFRLVGVDDSSSQGTYEDNVLPEGWNAYGPGHYTFRYKHEQSSLEFVMKLAKLGTRFTINAIAVEVRTHSFGRRVVLNILAVRPTMLHPWTFPRMTLPLRHFSRMIPMTRTPSPSSTASFRPTASRTSCPSSSS